MNIDKGILFNKNYIYLRSSNMIESKLIKVGDSLYVLVPMTLVKAFELEEKQPVFLTIEDDKIVIRLGKNDAVC